MSAGRRFQGGDEQKKVPLLSGATIAQERRSTSYLKIGNLRRLQLQLEFVCDKGNKFRIRWFSLSIGRTELMFPITERAVQKQLRIVCDYLGFEGISTHSFRKWYATEIYNANGFDIALVQRLLQHSSASTTQRYIGIEPQRIEQAIQNHAQLL
jgi:integrase